MKTTDIIKLTKNLLECESLQEIMDLAYDALGNPCFIVDMNSDILAYSSAPVKNIHWEKIVLNRELQSTMIDPNIHILSEHAAAFNSDVALFIEDAYEGEPQIKKALVYNGKRLGLFMLVQDAKELERKDTEIADLVGEIIVQKLVSHVGFLNLREVQKNSFFASILEGKKYSEEHISKWLSVFKISPADYYYVCVVKPNHRLSDIPENETDLTPLDIGAIANAFGGFAFLYNLSVVIIIPSGNNKPKFFYDEDNFLQFVNEQNMSVGISTYFKNIAELSFYYQQALKAVSLGHLLKSANKVFFYDRIVFYDIIQQMPSKNLEKYIHPDVALLKEYDSENNTDLCRTLLAYLENNRSLSKAAKELFVHKNTVNYRINQIKKILNIEDIDDSKEMFIYAFSLTISNYIESVATVEDVENNYN